MINRRSLLGLFATAPIAAKIAPAPVISQEIIDQVISVESMNAIKAEMSVFGMTGRISDASGSLMIDFANNVMELRNELYDDLQYELFTEH